MFPKTFLITKFYTRWGLSPGTFFNNPKYYLTQKPLPTFSTTVHLWEAWKQNYKLSNFRLSQRLNTFILLRGKKEFFLQYCLQWSAEWTTAPTWLSRIMPREIWTKFSTTFSKSSNLSNTFQSFVTNVKLEIIKNFTSKNFFFLKNALIKNDHFIFERGF